LEYDFVVKAGADPSQIRLAFNGQSKLSLTAKGDLELTTAAGKSINHKPVVYQTINSSRKSIEGEYVLLASNEIGIKLGQYDRSQALVIDPVLSVVAFFGGTGDDAGWGIAANSTGVYLAGSTTSTNFPLTPDVPGAKSSDPLTTPVILQKTKKAATDAFVTKLSADGTTLIYSTYLGGSADDVAKAIAVDGTGAAYITGSTGSPDLAVTSGTFGGGRDAFIGKLAPNGQTLSFLVYFGGAGLDDATSITVNSANSVYIGGYTTGGLVNVNGAKGTFGGGTSDGFVAKFDLSGNYSASTYLGGSLADVVNAVAVDASGNVYATGNTFSGAGSAAGTFPTAPNTPATAIAIPSGTMDAFLVKIDATFSTLVSSVLSGPSNGLAIAIDVSGNVYVGGTGSTGLATLTVLKLDGTADDAKKIDATGTPGTNGFAASWKSDAITPSYLTYTSAASINGVAVDSDMQLYVAGAAPGTSGTKAFTGRFAANGTLIYSGTIGATGESFNAVAVNSSREAFFAGTSTTTGNASALTVAGLTGIPQYGWKGILNSDGTPGSLQGSAKSTLSDVLYAAIQFQDIFIGNPTSKAIDFSTNVNGTLPSPVYVNVSTPAGCLPVGTISGTGASSFGPVDTSQGTGVFGVSLATTDVTTTPVSATATLTLKGDCDNAPQIKLTFNVNTTLNLSQSRSLIFASLPASDAVDTFTVSSNAGTITYNLAFASETAPTGKTFPESCFTFSRTGLTAVAPAAFSGSITLAPSTFTVTLAASCSGLSAGTYTANLVLTGGGIATQTFPVSLTVPQSQVPTADVLVTGSNPLDLTFADATSAAKQTSYTLSSTLTGTAVSYTTAIDVTKKTLPASAISILGASGTIAANSATSTMVVQVSPAGLAVGNYAGDVTVTATGKPATTITINVAVGTGILVTSPTPASYTLSAPQGISGVPVTPPLIVTRFPNGATVTAKAITVTGLPANVLGFSAPASGCPTIAASGSGIPSGGCTYNLTVDATTLKAGTLTGAINFASADTGVATVSIPVTLTVTSTPTLILTTDSAGTKVLPASGVTINLSRDEFGAIAGTCGSTTTVSTVWVATNGGTLGISTPMQGPVSNAALTLTIVSSLSSPIVTTPSKFTMCVGPTNGVLPGVYPTSVIITDAFSNKTTIPVTISVGTMFNSQIAVFRTAPDGVYGTFALDVNGSYAFDRGTDKFTSFGLAGDQPVAAKFYAGTGDTKVHLGVFRNGVWYIDKNDNGVWDGLPTDDILYFGLPGDKAVVGDWTGDGVPKLGVFRNGTWYLDAGNKHAWDPATAVIASFGLPGDIPVVSNNWLISGNIDQIGVFRCPTVGVCSWIVDSNGDRAWQPTDSVFSYGLTGDKPIVGNWNGNGSNRIGVFRNGTLILDNNGSNAWEPSDQVGSFGLAGDLPVVGNWAVITANLP
jgi:hypothetical protein